MWKTEKSFSQDKKSQNNNGKRVKTTPKKCQVWIILSYRGVENSLQTPLFDGSTLTCPHAVLKDMNSKISRQNKDFKVLTEEILTLFSTSNICFPTPVEKCVETVENRKQDRGRFCFQQVLIKG
jgi:hypothetical protein